MKNLIFVLLAFALLAVMGWAFNAIVTYTDRTCVKVSQEVRPCGGDGLFQLTTSVVRGWVHGGTTVYSNTSNCVTITDLRSLKPSERAKANTFATALKQAIKEE